ncbi:MAG: uncharacterized protein H6Q86_2254, partial [candidate division NC10 bacterium]|nr:uncharacterized protein [candidate division NC10 bacterium]
MDIWVAVAVAVGMALVGLIVGRAMEQGRQHRLKQGAGEEAKRIVREAERDIEARRKEAELEIKARTLQARTEFEQESRGRREEIQNFEKRLNQREEILDRKLEVMDRREREMAGREQELRARDQAVSKQEAHWTTLVEEAQRKLERVAGLTAEEAKAQLMQALEEEAKLHAVAHIKRIEDVANETGEERAKAIIGR